MLKPKDDDPNNPLESIDRPGEKAELVVAMGCDSSSLSGVFQGSGTFIGVDGGADNASSTYGLNQAIIATVQAIVDARGNLSQATLNTIVNDSQTVIRDNTAQKNPDPDDRVVLNPAVLPPQPYERFPRRP